MRQYTYFISDLHLGATYLKNPLDYERRVVSWLKSIKNDAKSLYLMGDILDYWYEYRTVVPRGFTRFFGTIAELADLGVEITWFIGNHDIWIFDYLPQELGIRIVDGSEIVEIEGKRFFLAHGDGIGKLSAGFKLIRSLFRNRFCQWLFAAIHPRWTIPFAHRWSSHSRNYSDEAPQSNEELKEILIPFCQDYLKEDPTINYFVMGHLHVMLNYQLQPQSQLIILGDWIHHFSYAKFDGIQLTLHQHSDK